jgi:hypothetical protein
MLKTDCTQTVFSSIPTGFRTRGKAQGMSTPTYEFDEYILF